ncbi:DNA starvation/stationary phase protection protein [Streptomyces albiflavescens]|uniref:DNA starvation/stationary phase protection protein n=1 Tax=Streptomyces albiflavescens TaxID=1623582 RepID=A0A917Y241_9ACTN|nr:DNA starvation/stationary phase protection protein [Streptomyces albiflavescens]GGN62140.1 DNA starvation/stationary phase protection protein [Streptomyces albiflavescens]
MSVIKSPLPEADRKVVADALQGALVDLIDVSMTAKQAHWSLYGPRFRSIHLQLDEMVSGARAFSDAVAERAAALGITPDGRAATVATSSSIPAYPAGWVKDSDAVAAVVESLALVIARMRERVTSTADADPVTQDLIIGITADLEKQHWMFQAENN